MQTSTPTSVRIALLFFVLAWMQKKRKKKDIFLFAQFPLLLILWACAKHHSHLTQDTNQPYDLL